MSSARSLSSLRPPVADKRRAILRAATEVFARNGYFNSKVADIVHELRSYGLVVQVHDPLADREEVKREYGIDLLPKVKVELVLDDKLVDTVIDAIIKSAATGKIGDGKIFLYKVDEAIRIRSQERGAAAL